MPYSQCETLKKKVKCPPEVIRKRKGLSQQYQPPLALSEYEMFLRLKSGEANPELAAGDKTSLRQTRASPGPDQAEGPASAADATRELNNKRENKIHGDLIKRLCTFIKGLHAAGDHRIPGLANT